MRWRASMWLLAVLIAATSATKNPIITIEDNPLHYDEYQDPLIDPIHGNTRIGETETSEYVTDDEPDTTTNEDKTPYDSTTDSTEPDTESSGEANTASTPVVGECSINQNLIVQTNSGLVQGFPWQDTDNIIGYYDIPYGTISNPFQAATSTEKWEDVHCIQEHEKRCPQLNNNEYVGDTNCLTLSIFKPLSAENANVLFHIHAENFLTGSGDPYLYGPDYLVPNDIILVLPNYRIGPLGFLCMQNETVPGNIALKDLSKALSWLHDNIKSFGGNPDNIAVSGEGRSGALAGLLALYPMSKANVKKVITESGSFLSYWSLDRDPAATATDFFERIKENTGEESIVDISLEELDMKTIIKAAKGMDFKPCLETENENAFMTISPYAILTKEKIETSFLIGSAMFAGAYRALDQTESSITKLNEDYALLLPNDLEFSTSTLRQQTGQKVKEQYFGDDPIKLTDIENISLYFTDMGYLGPGIRTARHLVAAGATVYFYEFAFAGKLNRVLDALGHPVDGAVRGDIIGYLFTQDGVVPKEDQISEKQMVETLTQMWTNFLDNGLPSTQSVQWKKLEEADEQDEEWLLIDSEWSMQKGLHVKRLPLWTEIYNEHYIEGSDGFKMSPSIYIIIIFQCTFFFAFCTNVSHMF